MKKSLFLIAFTLILSCLAGQTKAQDHAPSFAGGHMQTLVVCENSGAASLNSLLAVNDSDTGDTEVWSAVTGPAHGALVSAYSTTSTRGLLTPTGLYYTPASGFSGNDTLAIQVTDGTLMDTTYIYVTVRALPYAASISGFTAVCVGSSISLTDSTTGGFWGITNSNASITGGGTLTGIAAGTDTVNYFVVNTCGTAIATSVITINPLPHVSALAGSAGVCTGDITSLTDSVAGGTWSASNGDATVVAGMVHGITNGIDTIYYNYTNTCGTATTQKVITVNPLPGVSAISGATTVCVAATIALTDSTTGGTWSASNGNATLDSGSVMGIMAGLDTISYSLTNSCGTATATLVVTINPLADAGAISGAASVCVGASTVLTETTAGGVWSATNSNATVSDSLVTGVTPGIDTIRYAVTNSCGTTTSAYAITITAIPSAGPVTGPTGVCLGSSITLAGGTPGGTWSATNAHATLSADTATGVSIGRDTIAYMVSNACGADTAHFVISVDTAAPSAGTIHGVPVLCVGNSITVTDSAFGGVWSSSNTALATVNATGSGMAIASGIDTIRYTVTNGCGSVAAIYRIAINPLPHAGTITGYDSVCAGLTILMVDTVSGGTWVSTGPFFASIEASGRVHGLLHGSTTILYIVSNSCGSDTAQHNVNINLPAQPVIGPSTICQSFTTPNLYIDLQPGGTWSSSNYLVAPIITYMGGGGVIGLTVGTADIIYTVHNACGTTADSLLVTVINCTGVGVPETQLSTDRMTLSPNPSNGKFTVTLNAAPQEPVTLTIVNVLGQKVKELSLTGITTDISLNAPKGIYFVTALVGGVRETKQMVVGE